MASKPPALVWPDGRPIMREALGREVAAAALGTVRSIQSGHPAQGLDPRRLARLLLDAEMGDAVAYCELAEEMEEKDLHYLSVLNTRKRAVLSMPITVEAADGSEQAKADAKLVEDWLQRDVLRAELFDVLDAIGKGYSVTEMVWDLKPKLWQPRVLKWRDPRWFEFDRIDGETLRLRGAAGPEELDPGKFIAHFHPSKSGLPIRSGLARIVAWGYMFKNFAIKDWAVFLEAYGHPLRVGKYGPNESEENKRILERALHALGTDAAAAFPETMSVEFVDRKAGTAPNDLWRSHAEYFDMQISKVVLGQTNTTDAQSGGLGSGQANVHNEVRGDIRDSDAIMLSATLNRDLVVPLVLFNHGPRDKYPRIKIELPDDVDVKMLLDASERLVAMGVEIDADEVRERAGVPAAKAGGKVLLAAGAVPPADPEAEGTPANSPQVPPERQNGTQPAAAPAKGFLDLLKGLSGVNETALAAAGSREAEREPDFINATAAEALDDWQALVDPLLEPVERLIDDCGDLAELQSRLAEALTGMDPARFHQLLARGAFAARIAGLADPAGAPEPEA